MVLYSHLLAVGDRGEDGWAGVSGTKLVAGPVQTITFLVPMGLADRHATVRKSGLDAAVATIDLHGKGTAAELLLVFENHRDSAPDCPNYDIVRRSMAILMGGLVRHPDKEAPKVRPIEGKLATPSQWVQEVVASCLPPLTPNI